MRHICAKQAANDDVAALERCLLQSGTCGLGRHFIVAGGSFPSNASQENQSIETHKEDNPKCLSQTTKCPEPSTREPQ